MRKLPALILTAVLTQGSGFDDHGTIFIHAGFTAEGPKADLWSFDVASRTWSQLPDAPGLPRGGAGLVFTQDRLYRFGGCDDKEEIGGYVDVLHLAVSTFDDKGGKGELALTPRTGEWHSFQVPHGDSPGGRSVAGLQPVTTGQGRNYLVLFLGEKQPSSSFETAGKFWDDVWSYQIKPDGMTAASFKDATRYLFGAKDQEGMWARVGVPEGSKSQGIVQGPGGRGWFASSQGQDLGAGSIVLWGGLKEDNTRAGDGWILTVDA